MLLKDNLMTRTALKVAGIAVVALGALAVAASHAQSKTPGYMVIEYEVTDRAGYQEYLRASAAIRASGAGGTFLVRGAAGTSLSGEPPKTVAIIQFASIQEALAFDASPEYTALKANRDQSLKWRSFVVEGVGS